MDARRRLVTGSVRKYAASRRVGGREECKDDPECQAAFEYAATHLVWPDEIAYIGAITVRKAKQGGDGA